ncbi:SNARE associated Golgi protein [Dermatophilus congolensis]|uniref:SNARE associated Golgi protein n=3 Tax=Dermatophilus congolensis TaxID=1863 RepID=A0A239V6B3_9MICO|nr:SNARE associated Golgi protein [Dermatophilus congolensis]
MWEPYLLNMQTMLPSLLAGPAPAVGGLLDPMTLIQGWGPWALVGVATMTFIESGVLFPFLPGDSLLFTAGLLHEPLGYSLFTLIFFTTIAAILGDQVGYFLGHKFGRQFFKPDAKILKTKYLDEAEAFFAKYGGRSIVLARFVPLVRTFVPLVAGMTQYGYQRFVGWNIFGGTLWVTTMCTAGALLGGIPFIAKNVDLIAVGIVAISLIPVALQVWTSIKDSKKAAAEKNRTPTNQI